MVAVLPPEGRTFYPSVGGVLDHDVRSAESRCVYDIEGGRRDSVVLG
jgi:hypothetical protein